MAKLYTQLQEVCDFSADAAPLSTYPGGKFTNIAVDACSSAGGVCVRGTAAGSALYTFNTTVTPPANSAVEATVDTNNGLDRFIGIVGRYVNSTTFYQSRLDTVAGYLDLYRFSPGGAGYTLLGTYVTAAKTGTIYLEFADEVGGHTDVRVYLDDVLRIEYHDETPVGFGAANKAGIRWTRVAGAGTLDNLAIRVAAAGAPGASRIYYERYLGGNS